MKYASVVITALLLAGSDAQLRYFSNLDDFESSLQPVQGLYVKPSNDGATGDLFVAASEDSGVQTPWVADTSVKLVQDKQDPREEKQINKGNVAAVALKPETSEQSQYVQVPQLFYNQLLAAAIEGSDRMADRHEAAFPASYVQPWSPYRYPQPQFVLVDPEAWARVRSALAGPAEPAAAHAADEKAGQIRLVKV